VICNLVHVALRADRERQVNPYYVIRPQAVSKSFVNCALDSVAKRALSCQFFQGSTLFSCLRVNCRGWRV